MEPPTSQAAVGIEWLQQRLAHLQALSAALAAARSEQEAIVATLDSGLAVFEADQAVVATLDEGRAAFAIRLTRGYSQRIEADWANFPNSDEYPLSQSVRLQQPVIVHGEAELTRRYPKLAGTAQLRQRSSACRWARRPAWRWATRRSATSARPGSSS